VADVVKVAMEAMEAMEEAGAEGDEAITVGFDVLGMAIESGYVPNNEVEVATATQAVKTVSNIVEMVLMDEISNNQVDTWELITIDNDALEMMASNISILLNDNETGDAEQSSYDPKDIIKDVVVMVDMARMVAALVVEKWESPMYLLKAPEQHMKDMFNEWYNYIMSSTDDNLDRALRMTSKAAAQGVFDNTRENTMTDRMTEAITNKINNFKKEEDEKRAILSNFKKEEDEKRAILNDKYEIYKAKCRDENRLPIAIPEDFQCPIYEDIMIYPEKFNTIQNQQSYERSAIRNWLKDNDTHPITREEVNASMLKENDELATQITAFFNDPDTYSSQLGAGVKTKHRKQTKLRQRKISKKYKHKYTKRRH
jgi:hypothetical protein